MNSSAGLSQRPLEPSPSPTRPAAAAPAVRISTLPWIAGGYFLVLGMSLLILNPGTILVPIGMPWLRGAVTAASGLVLLWLAGVAVRRIVLVWVYVLVAVPQLAAGVLFVWQGSYAPGATLVFFSLGLLAAAVIRWRRGQPVPPAPAVESAFWRGGSGAARPDLAGFVLAASIFVQGLDNILRPGASSTLPEPLATALTVLGIFFLAAGVALALAQVFTRMPSALRWAAHIFAGLVLIATWVLFSANGDIGLWLRGSSLLLTGLSAAFLPLIGRRASEFDRRSLYPRLALALVSATTVPLLIAITAMVTSDTAVLTLPARQLAFSVTLITVVLCAAGGVWMASRLARPIEVVVQGANRLATGERQVELLGDNSPTEIVHLAHAVLGMAANLDARAAAQTELAQAAAVHEERQRIARDLHDSVSQTLTAIKMAAHSALTNWETKPEVARSRVELTTTLAGRAQSEMRALIFEVRPDQLAVDGLVQALQLQAAALEARHEFAVETSFCSEPDIPLPVKEAFYRIGQEALNNAVQHARPSRLVLTLTSGAGVVLALHDDGAGFDPDGSYPGHLGLRSMRERAARTGSALAIESGQAGTLVRLCYPADAL